MFPTISLISLSDFNWTVFVYEIMTCIYHFCQHFMTFYFIRFNTFPLCILHSNPCFWISYINVLHKVNINLTINIYFLQVLMPQFITVTFALGTSTLLLFSLKWPIIKVEKNLKISQNTLNGIYACKNLVKGGWQSWIFRDTPKSSKNGH